MIVWGLQQYLADRDGRDERHDLKREGGKKEKKILDVWMSGSLFRVVCGIRKWLQKQGRSMDDVLDIHVTPLTYTSSTLK